MLLAAVSTTRRGFRAIEDYVRSACGRTLHGLILNTGLISAIRASESVFEEVDNTHPRRLQSLQTGVAIVISLARENLFFYSKKKYLF